MRDTSPAIFIKEETAQAVSDRWQAADKHRHAWVSIHRKHGEIKGYSIRTAGGQTLTNDEVEPYL